MNLLEVIHKENLKQFPEGVIVENHLALWHLEDYNVTSCIGSYVVMVPKVSVEVTKLNMPPKHTNWGEC